ncbi:MAG: OmpA family protein [Silicimonas sp.]|nr:OmpA family protein [Silicimonas sp.]NND17827.1 OmpA family protein [Silicimonas sp.]NNL34742.1 OmpA family protein [Silicimonas sp.]NNL74112.1 OmpA family protein [Silicimonas sp.]RZW08273.1 MAG: OmpA family protein [Paracoccaceae bacterium]
MRLTKKPLILGAASLLALTACSDPAYRQGGERQRTGQGAAIGAAVGGLLGATRESGSDRVRNAAVGAAIGAAAGAAIGYSLDQQAAELRNDFGNGQIDVINTGNELIVRMPEAILFATDSASLNSQLRSDLFVLSDSLQKYPQSTVTVTGHTDSTGTAAYNQDLSQRRARSVASVLQQGGVAGSRLRVVGAGESQPIATNQTAAGRAQNRRVDITITPTK